MKTISTNKHIAINGVDTVAKVQLYAADYALNACVVCESKDGRSARFEVGALYNINMVRTCQDVATILLVCSTVGIYTPDTLERQTQQLAYQVALQLLAGSNLDADATAFDIIDLVA